MAGLAFGAVGCTTGPMRIDELHYYAVPGPTNINYYRLKVSGDTKLGVAEYRSGWYSADAVDALFGDVSSAASIESMRVRADLEKQILDAVKATDEAYLKAAQEPDASDAELEKLQLARRRVMFYPIEGRSLPPGVKEIEYNPRKGIQLRFADQKLVFVLASNPDEVIGKIATFAEDQKTAVEVDKLGDVVDQRLRNEMAGREGSEAVAAALDAVLKAQVGAAKAALGSAPTSRDEAIRQIDLLLRLLDNVGN